MTYAITEKVKGETWAYLAKYKDQLAPILPSHMSVDRMLRIAFASMTRNPKLFECTKPSLFMAILQAAQLGLEPGLRNSAHIIPFGKEAVMVVGYQGLVELILRTGKYSAVTAENVYTEDTFNFHMGSCPALSHTPCLDEKRGEYYCTYAVAYPLQGPAVFIIIPEHEMLKIRKSSKQSGGPAWKQWPEEMQKKTAVRRLSKYLEQSVEIRQALQLEEQVEGGVAPTVGIKGEEIFAPEVVSARTTEATDSLKTQIKGDDLPNGEDEQESHEAQPENPPSGKCAIEIRGEVCFNEPSKSAIFELGYKWNGTKGKGSRRVRYFGTTGEIDAAVDVLDKLSDFKYPDKTAVEAGHLHYQVIDDNGSVVMEK